jgi:hypothetical protein
MIIGYVGRLNLILEKAISRSFLWKKQREIKGWLSWKFIFWLG